MIKIDSNSKTFKLIKALSDKYNAQVSESLAHLDILFKNSVGIGEHTDILSELDKWMNNLSQAEENLKTLNKHFIEDKIGGKPDGKTSKKTRV